MAIKLADATAYLTTDDKELKSGLAGAEAELTRAGGGFSSVLTGIGMSIGQGIAGIATQAIGQVTQFIGESIGAASDLSETISKTQVLFGDSSGALLAWSQTAATTFGQSQQQALDAVTTFATFGSAAGIGGDQLVSFSTDFAELASDLASFNNTTPEAAIEAIGAALRGETEPMRAYGVMLDDASMRQEALKLGLIATTTEALTPQQKVLAAQSLIYQQTTAAQGDFARTSDGLANQQRILNATMEDLKSTVGQALLPVVLAFTGALNNLVQAVLPPLRTFMQERVIPVMQRFGDFISATLGPLLGKLSTWFSGLGSTMREQADGPMKYLSDWFNANMPRIQQIVDGVINALTWAWDTFGTHIMFVVNNTFGILASVVDMALRNVMDVVTLVLQLLTGDWTGAWETLNDIVERTLNTLLGVVTGLIANLTSLFTNVDWGAVGAAIIQGIRDGISAAWAGLVEWFRGKLEELRNMLPFSEPRDPTSPLRGLGKSGAATVEMYQAGMTRALDGLNASMAGGLAGLVGTPTLAGVGGGPMSITININGAGDATATGRAAERGVLAALRQAGVR